MRIHYFLIISTFLIASSLQATDYIISTEGTSYFPNDLDVAIGDNITIEASNTHPTAEVSEGTWNANGTTPLAGGFGTNTSAFTFTVDEAGTIYYVCTSHVGNFNMKGKINVSAVGVEEYIDEVSVEFGAMPITDGILDYSIQAPENVVQILEVVGLNGQQVYLSEVTSSQGRVELTARPGVYILLLKDADGNMVFRESISIK